jgi:hypothetical protein
VAKKKASGVNVSEEIRRTWDADQSQKPAAIVEALKGKGINTNPGTVATTLSVYRKKLGMKSLRRKRRRGRNAAQAAPVQVANNGWSISSVLEAVKLVSKAKELVGADGLREIVKAI